MPKLLRMFLNKILAYVFFFVNISLFAQGNISKKDSIKENKLNEVVVTGQLLPQSIKKSVFEVKVINRKEIEQRAANNLADLLNTTLNISIFNERGSGKSGINVLGLDAKYFKVLLDNIPIVNEEGFGNNTDLTTINLSDIERIELVEGAMGVQYGANAVSGVLNIITKKKSRKKWKITASIQEESVGKEYEWFNKGKHIQSVGIGHKLTEKDYINITFNRNDFRGFLDTLKGKHYDKDNRLRGYSWLPKEQNNTKLLFSHRKNGFSAFYKFDYLHENISYHDSIVRLNRISETQTSNPSSFDKNYTNHRFIHHINFTGKIASAIPYNISVSYQKQQKQLERFAYHIRKKQKYDIKTGTYLSKEVWFSRGTFSNIINTNKVNSQIGYEIINESGFGSPKAVPLKDGSTGVRNTLTNYDIFSSSEIRITEAFLLRPEIRISLTNLFDTQLYYSASTRYLFKNNIEARAILGFGARTPKYNELYTYFVDKNHNVQGNKNLQPEESLSAFFHLKKNTFFTENTHLFNRLTFSYIHVKDRIELIVIKQSPLELKYNNIDKFSSIGSKLENSLQHKNLTLTLGGSVFGNSKYIDYRKKRTSSFFYNYQANVTASYRISRLNTSFAIHFKHLGKTNRFVEVEGRYEIQNIQSHSWLDISAKKQFLNKKLVATLGVRNLLDVSSVATSNTSAGAHKGRSSSISMGYGRSYFVKLAYNINI